MSLFKNIIRVLMCSVFVFYGALSFAAVTPQRLGQILLGNNYTVITNNYSLPGHAGIDYRARTPLAVYSPVNGIVTASNSNWGHLAIKIDNSNTHFIFLHLSRIDYQVGDRVASGGQIGLSGDVEYNGFPITAAHLHVEARNGRSNPADPSSAASYQHNFNPSDVVTDSRRNITPIISMLLLDDTETSPKPISISSGTANGCILNNNGTIKCWGVPSSIGNGTSLGSYVPVLVSNINNGITVSSGSSFNCALATGGNVYCWGKNGVGNLGNGTNTDSLIPVLAQLNGIAVKVATGDNRACAILNDGTIKCWGSNYYGQLGDGKTNNSTVPVLVQNISNAIDVSIGGHHACAVLDDGTGRCWGFGAAGQLGNGATSNSSVPVIVSGLTNAKQISAGNIHSCAVLNNGTIKCWGSNYYGQLGDGKTNNSNIPVLVTGITSAAYVSAGLSHNCSRLTDKNVKCWGVNNYGQLGIGNLNLIGSRVPVTLISLSNVIFLDSGQGHTCSLDSNGTAKCWGWNRYGQLGNGTTTDSNVPINVVLD